MLHWQTVSPELKILLSQIGKHPAFSSFRLCGGTALALQLGHRLSVDADYVAEARLDKEELMAIIAQELPNSTDIFAGEIGVFLKADNIKLDFLSWNIPFIRPAITYENIQLVHIEEIAAMKLFAITQRGEKKDYYDIAVLLESYSLKQILQFYKERHPNNDTGLVTKFLTSFSDINFQPEPIKLIDFSWEHAKNSLQSKVKTHLEA